MAYIPPYVDNALNAIVANPASMAGTPQNGAGHNFKTRIKLREAQQQVAPGLTNLETYQPTTLAGAVATRARILATT